MGFRELSVWNDYLERVILKNSRREILDIARQIPGVIKVIKETQKTLNSSRSLFGRVKYDEFFNVTSSIMELASRIFAMAVQFQRESQKGLGEFISTEMIEEALLEASQEVLSAIASPNFTGPRQVHQLREEIIDDRTHAFFENKKEEILPTLPREPVEIVEEDMIIDQLQNPMELFYHEIALKMHDVEKEEMGELLYRDLTSFGHAMYKTGQLLKLTSELRNRDDPTITGKECFVLLVGDLYKHLTAGPVEIVTECVVEKKLSTS
jgi:hypothetical protein